jgi:sulfite exporter TauE/SafE
MLWQVMIAGLTLGATGSLHCVGMCGPLSLALPTQHMSAAGKIISLLLYQIGRVITYSIIGLLVGLLGRSIYIAGYQQLFSIILGSIVLVLAFIYFIQRGTFRSPLLARIYDPVQKLIIRAMNHANGPFGFLLMGMANGLLPCGMVYLALAAALSFGELSETVSFMAMFGLGTLPAMLLVAFAGRMINFELRKTLRKIVPVFVALTGAILILRGMNLGIPLLSPELPESGNDAINCQP